MIVFPLCGMVRFTIFLFLFQKYFPPCKGMARGVTSTLSLVFYISPCKGMNRFRADLKSKLRLYFPYVRDGPVCRNVCSYGVFPLWDGPGHFDKINKFEMFSLWDVPTCSTGASKHVSPVRGWPSRGLLGEPFPFPMWG